MADLGGNDSADEFANQAAFAADGATRTLAAAEGANYRDDALIELAIALTYLSKSVRELFRDVRRLKQ